MIVYTIKYSIILFQKNMAFNIGKAYVISLLASAMAKAVRNGSDVEDIIGTVNKNTNYIDKILPGINSTLMKENLEFLSDNIDELKKLVR